MPAGAALQTLLLAAALSLPVAPQGRWHSQRASAAPAESRGSAPAAPLLPGCPGADFAEFLRAFGEDPAVQRQHSRFPMQYVTVEQGPDEPTTRERWLPADSLPWPLLPSARARTQAGLELTVDSTSEGQWRATVAKPDTDLQMSYHFVRDRGAGSCWKLVRFDNESL